MLSEIKARPLSNVSGTTIKPAHFLMCLGSWIVGDDIMVYEGGSKFLRAGLGTRMMKEFE
jgi:hypothetical protein